MKKIILFVSCIMLYTSIFSQVSIGLTVGSNLFKTKKEVDFASNPSLMVPDKEEQKVGYGLIIGIPLEISLSNRFAIFTALTYHQKGNKIKTAYSYYTAYFEAEGLNRYNYLELPVQGKFYFTKKTLSTYVLLGPSVGYILNGRVKMDGYSDSEAEGISYFNVDEKMKSEDFKDSGINRLDLSLVIGAGVSYKVWIGDIFLNINYNHGFLNMANGDEQEIYKGVTIKNRGCKYYLWVYGSFI